MKGANVVTRKWAMAIGLAISIAASTLIIVLPATGSSPASAASDVTALNSAANVTPSALPATVSGMLPNLPGPEGDQGTPISNNIHVLMRGLGVNGISLYAYPTTSGSVCVIASESVPAGTCVAHFDPQTMPVAVNVYSEQGAPPSVMGVAPDDVSGVDVVVDGVAQPAAVDGNGVFYQTPVGTPPSAITAVVTHFDDGSTATQKFNLNFSEPPKP